MLDLELNQRVRNGRHGPSTTMVPSTGLGNTNPMATCGSTFASDAPVIPGQWLRGALRAEMERLTDHDVIQGGSMGSIFAAHSMGARVLARGLVGSVAEVKVLRPAGQVVLFQKVMEQWAFSETEAATLLGFEDAADIRAICEGRKLVGHRDANDRLRAVLRIAADIDALFDDKDAIRDWLNEPQKDLGGNTPRALLTEGSLESLLQVKYYAAHLSGR